MVPNFTHTGSPARIIFGSGAIGRLEEEVDRLEWQRVMILSTPMQRAAAEKIADSLGARGAGVFDGATMHTPVSVTESAMLAFQRSKADGLISFGGGTTVGLGKAIAFRTGVGHLAIATTYAGSEVTPILGQTEDGVKTTLRDPRLLPGTVIYDPDLTLGLPKALSMTSGLNAMAHAVEGLYAPDRNPITSLLALEGVRALSAALPVVSSTPNDLEARTEALYGAWLCGTVLGTVGMSLHHKLCHVLGGSFELPHAEVHSVVLPYATAYNAAAAREQLQPLHKFFGNNLGAGLKKFAAELGAPSSLRDLGLPYNDLDRVVSLSVKNAYANPRTPDALSLREMLERAWTGEVPN